MLLKLLHLLRTALVCLIPLVATVAYGQTSTSLALTANGSVVTTVAAQTVITLTATVTSGGSAVTPGLVSFCDATAPYCGDIHLLGTAQLTRAGTATFKFVPGPGSHSYYAAFNGTHTYSRSVSPHVPLKVVAAGSVKTTVGIQAAGQQGNYTLLGTVASNGATPPTGSASFLDTSNANYNLGTATLTTTGPDGIAFLNTFNYPTPLSPYPIGNGQYNYLYLKGDNVLTADFNGDGIPDILIANAGNNTIVILLGKGDGTFTAQPVPNPGGFTPGYVAVGDFNADGKTDFAVTNNIQEGVAIYLGNGDGTFTPGQALPSPNSGVSTALQVADFNGDGIADLVDAVTQQLAGQAFLQVYLGNGDGTFTAVPTQSLIHQQSIAESIAVADFNGDGLPDVAAAGFGITIMLGNGDGTFSAAPIPNIDILESPDGLAVADLNQDGKADLVATSIVPPSVVTPPAPPPSTLVLLGNGDGTFTPLASDPNLSKYSDSVTIADFNNDGIPDMVLPDIKGGTVNVYLGRGDGTFIPDAFSPGLANEVAFSFAVADFNGDGQSDIAELVLDDIGFDIPPNDYLGVLLAQSPSTVAGYIYNVSPVGTGYHYVDASYSGDSNHQPGLSSTLPLLAEQVTTTLTLTATPASGTSVGQPVTLTATLSPFLAQDHSASGTVTFTYGGKTLGTATVNNGVATITVTTLPLGTDRITASYPGDTNFTASTSSLRGYQIVNPPPTLALTITTVGAGAQAVSTVAAQTPVALVATVAANGTAVTAGQVNFCDATAAHCTDIHLLGAAQLNSSGVAVLRFVPGLGGHSYKAVLAATKAFGAATSNTAALAVTGKVASSTVLVATGGPGDYTLTATVTGDSAVFPTGTIPFIDTTNANASLGSATLVAGATTRSFASPTTLSTGINPISVAESDFNNDGKTDIAVINEGSSLQIFLGNGDGTFAAGMTVSTSFVANYDTYVVVADFNDDGNADIAVANRGNANLFIFLGNGDGTFTAAASPAVSLGSEGMAAGDFNGDGIVDLAVGNQGSNSISILLGKGDGTFTAAPSIPTQYTAFFLAVGDFNGDGKADLAATSIYSSDVFILLGNGDGTFTAGTSITGVPFSYSVTTADFNGDGKIDLAVTSGDYGNPFVYLGKGDGTFTEAASSSIADSGVGISVGDFNQDGIPDLVVSEYDGKTLDVFLGNGDGTFGSPSQFITNGQSTSTAIADFDGNGLPDIATVNFHGNSAQVFLNEVSSTATATVTNVVPVGTGTHYAEASYAGDAIYNPSVSNLVPLIAGLPPTTTVASVSPNPSAYGQPVVFSVHVAPVTANASVPSGQVVFTFCHGAQDTVTLDANGNGSFLYPPPGNANVVAEPVGSCAFTAEYMGDSKFESSTSTAVAYVVVPSPSTTAVVASPNPAYQGQVVTLTATITGVPSPTLNPVTGNPIPPAQTPGTGTVQFFDGSTLIGTAAVNGSNQAVLTTSSLAAGTHSITAVYSGDANLGGSGSGSYSEVILASTFTIALSPTTITLAAGQPGSVAVQLASVGLFAGPLTLTYGALPMYATAKMTPGTVTLAAGGTGAATFSLNTVVKAESVTPVRPGSRAVPGVFAAVVLLMLPWVRGRRKRLARLMAMVMAAVVLQGMTGCTNVSYLLSTVAPGTYAVPITATDANGNAKSAVLTVVVTP